MHACVLVLVPVDEARRRLSSVLESQGHAPLEAPDTPAALRVLGGIRPDLVVLSGACVTPWRATGHGEGALLSVDPHPDAPCLPAPYTRTQFTEAVRGALGSRRPVLQLGDRAVDLHLREVRGPVKTVRLTPTECDFLAALADRRGRVVPSAELVAAVWGHAGASTVSVTARRVRNKIEVDPANPVHLRTVHGVGLELHLPQPIPTPAIRLRGRDALIAQIAEATTSHPLVTVFGAPGVGASSVALAAAPQRTRIDLRGAQSAEDIAVAISRALSLKREQSTDPVKLLAHLAQPVLFDDVDTARAPLAALLDEALTHATDPSWLVTAHAPLAIAGEHTVPVPPLELTEAVAYLEAEVPGLQRAAEVAEALEGLPLALELAAPVLRTLGPDPLLETWATRFALLGADDGGPGRLEAAFESSWEGIDPQTRSALATLSLVEGPLGMADALELAGPRPLMAAVSAGLVQRSGASVSLLGVVRAFVLARTDASVRIDAGEAHLAWVQRREVSIEDTLVAAEFALSRGNAEIALDRLNALETRMRVQGDQPRWIALLERAVDQADPETAPEAVGKALTLLGAAALPKAEVVRPLLQRALALATAHDLPEIILRAETRLGDAAFYTGDPDGAAEHFDRAAAIAPDTPYAPFAQFRRAHYLAFGRPWDAESDAGIEEALHRVRAHPFERMNTAMVRAAWLDRTGRGAEAVSHYRDCLAVARRADDDYSLARFLCTAGGAYVQHGRAAAAEAMLTEALALRRHQAHDAGIAACLGNLAELHALRGALHLAEQTLQEALTHFARVGHRRAEALCGINFASLWARARRLGDAERMCAKTEQDLEAAGMRGMAGHLLEIRSTIAAASGDLERAGALAAEALAVAIDGRAVRAELAAECWAIELLAARGAPEALPRAEALVERVRRSGNFRLEGRVTLALWRLTADPAWVESVETCLQETGDPTLQARLALTRGEDLPHPTGDLQVADDERTISLLVTFDRAHSLS